MFQFSSFASNIFDRKKKHFRFCCFVCLRRCCYVCRRKGTFYNVGVVYIFKDKDLSFYDAWLYLSLKQLRRKMKKKKYKVSRKKLLAFLLLIFTKFSSYSACCLWTTCLASRLKLKVQSWRQFSVLEYFL